MIDGLARGDLSSGFGSGSQSEVPFPGSPFQNQSATTLADFQLAFAQARNGGLECGSYRLPETFVWAENRETSAARESMNVPASKKALMEGIAASKLSEPEKQQLEKAVAALDRSRQDNKDHAGNEFRQGALASTFAHANRLLKQGCPAEHVLDALSNAPVRTSNYTIDSSGNYSNDGRAIKEPQREDRDSEIWSARLTDFGNKSIQTVCLNGREIESWLITNEGGKVVDLQPLMYPDPQPDNEGLKEARRSLVAAVCQSGITNSARLEFFSDMARIEHRTRSGEMGRSLAAIRTELTQTYQQLERFFKEDARAKVPLNERIIAGRQTAHQLAIDQGPVSDACRITVAETRLSVVRPSVPARIIADLVIAGETKFGNGKTIALDDESLKPSGNLCTTFPRPQNERSYASQLFQLAVMNLLGTDPLICKEHIFFANLDEKQKPFREYEQLIFRQTREKRGDRDERVKKDELLKKNNGLVVYGRSGNKIDRLTEPGILREGTNQILLQACMTQQILNMIDPGRHENIVLAHKDFLLYTREHLFDDSKTDTRGMVLFSNAQELEKLVQDAKRDGRLPLIIANRNTLPDPGEPAPSLKPNETNHIITIRDYIPARGKEPARFVTDDHFGRNDDLRNATLAKLWESVGPPK